MNVLFLNAYYEPEAAASLYLCTNLCEDLAANGFEVDLFTPTPSRGVSKEVRKEYKKRRYEKKGNLIIHRVSIPREGKKTILRALRYIWMNIVFLYLGFRAKTNLIFLDSTPPTQGAMGAILRKIKGVPVVYYLQDIFPDSLADAGLTNKNSIVYRVGRIMESFTYKNIDRIIVNSYGVKQNIMRKGVPENNIDVVYNWVDQNDVFPVERDDNLLFDKLDLPRDPFYVVYAGNLGHAQNIEVILEAAKMLEKNNAIRFVIFGNGAREDYFKKRLKDLGLSNTHIFPLRPYSEVSYVYSFGDVSIVSCKKGYGKSAMPSKTWSIMSAARPVLASFDEDSDLHHIIENNDVGIFCGIEDADALKNAIEYLFQNKELRLQMGHNARNYIMDNLTREKGTSKIISIINSELVRG